jgi:DnaJ like chaperone protein
MGSFKWIAGFLGWVTWGPIGALLGFLAGSAIEDYIEGARQLPGGASSSTHSYSQSQQHTDTRGYTAAEQRNSFLVSLLVLSAAVIKADGRALQSELDYVKEFVRKNFGDAAVPQAIRMLEQFTRQDVNIYEIGPQIARYMNYSQRLQLFHYLVQIAMADGEFHKREKSVLEAIGNTISLSNTDINSVISMFSKEVSVA